MSQTQGQQLDGAPASGEQEIQFGKGREPGVAGPDAEYIIRSLDRWRLRGDGILSSR